MGSQLCNVVQLAYQAKDFKLDSNLGANFEAIKYGIFVFNGTHVGVENNKTAIYCEESILSPREPKFSYDNVPVVPWVTGVLGNLFVLIRAISIAGHGIPTSPWWRMLHKGTTGEFKLQKYLNCKDGSKMVVDLVLALCFVWNLWSTFNYLAIVFGN